MKKKRKVDFKEIGLDMGLILAKRLFNTEYLHYGYWTEDLPVHSDNILAAQEAYAEFIVSHIPKGTKTILDVGCGAGKFAEKLLDLGFAVDCVSPSPNLTKHVRRILGDRSKIFECGYEEVETDNRYDLVLFSESFQYIPTVQAISQSLKFLNPGGQILICDFFRKKVEGKSPIGGGHDIEEFYHTVGQSPLQVIEDIDITKETAPSLDIMDDLLTNTIQPIYDLFAYAMKENYPKFTGLVGRMFKKRFEKINFKYFQQRTNGQSFAHFKTYHLMVYKRSD
jgi:SAM-dependent methyltransferase